GILNYRRRRRLDHNRSPRAAVHEKEDANKTTELDRWGRHEPAAKTRAYDRVHSAMDGTLDQMFPRGGDSFRAASLHDARVKCNAQKFHAQKKSGAPSTPLVRFCPSTFLTPNVLHRSATMNLQAASAAEPKLLQTSAGSPNGPRATRSDPTSKTNNPRPTR